MHTTITVDDALFEEARRTIQASRHGTAGADKAGEGKAAGCAGRIHAGV